MFGFYMFVFYFTYFFVLIMFLIAACFCAKKRTCWLYYMIGAIIQFLVLQGNEKTIELSNSSKTMHVEWVIYFALLVISAVVILIIKRKNEKNTQKSENKPRGNECPECGYRGTYGSNCPVCGTYMEEIDEAGKSSLKDKTLNIKLKRNYISIILALIACSSILIAINTQDGARRIRENVDPSLMYFAVVVGLALFLIVVIISLIKERYEKTCIVFSLVPTIITIIALIEGSIFSDKYFYLKKLFYYKNNTQIIILNIIWIVAVFGIFVINLPKIYEASKIIGFKLKMRHYSSVKYREKCYDRVAKLHAYLDSGIITQEQYENTKKDIMKNLNEK